MTEDDDSNVFYDKRRRIYNIYRTGVLVFTSLYTFFFAGAFFGYGPMILLLQRDEAFFWKCDDENEEPTCPDQKSQLLNIHFVGTLMQILTPFVGHLCDTRGPFATMFYTAATALVGIAVLIISRAIPIDELLYPAFCFLGMNAFATSVMCVATGRIFSIYSKEQVGQTDMGKMEEAKVPQELDSADSMTRSLEVSEEAKKGSDKDQGDADDDYKSEEQDDGSQDKGPRRVIGFLNNLFDAGSVTYLIMWVAHKNLGTSLQVLCYWYLGAGVLIFGGTLTCWMLVLKHQQKDKELQEEADRIRKSIVTIAEGRSTVLEMEKQEAALQNDHVDDSSTKEPQILASTEHADREEVMEDDSKEEWRELFSASFLWLVAFFAFHVARNIFVLTSAEAFLKDLGDTSDKYISIFTMMMPASVLGFPFVDWALGKFGYHKALQLINLFGLVHGIIQISATANLDIQIIGFLVFSFYRCFLFSVIFAYLSALMPEKVLGKANGFLHISAGAAGLLNIPLGNAAVQQWNGSFFIPNCLYTFGILPFFYAAYGTTAGIRSKQNQRQNSTGTTMGFSKRLSSLFGNSLYPSLSATDDEVAKA